MPMLNAPFAKSFNHILLKKGVQRDDEGREFQTMVCSECKTSNRVYTGKEGEDFQSNYDYPDNTDLSDIE